MRKVIMFLVVLVVILGVVSQFLPADYSVQRSIVVAAEPEQVYPHLADLKTWPEWTAWTRERDPGAEWNFEGSEMGAGAVMKWSGTELGNGELTLTDGTPTEGIKYDMSFDEGKFVSKGRIVLTKEGDGTKVTWVNEGDLGKNPISRYMGLMLDRMMGPDFEEGLEGLKTRLAQ